MTLREKAICEVFTGICFCAGDKRGAVYEYASELLGRPIFTHEFYTLRDELKEKARPDFVALCQDELAGKTPPEGVVLCKDCKHRVRPSKMCSHPKAVGWDAIEPDDDAFCSYGEREEAK